MSSAHGLYSYPHIEMCKTYTISKPWQKYLFCLEGIDPNRLKYAKVIPVHNSGDETLVIIHRYRCMLSNLFQ